tara:strand:- start:30 stop:188 length:159 start_codon:yes stop_codon:yes gene_type:complete
VLLEKREQRFQVGLALELSHRTLHTLAAPDHQHWLGVILFDGAAKSGQIEKV